MEWGWEEFLEHIWVGNLLSPF